AQPRRPPARRQPRRRRQPIDGDRPRRADHQGGRPGPPEGVGARAPAAPPRGADAGRPGRGAPPPPPLGRPREPGARARPPPARPSGARETRERMTPIRQRVAERLLAAQQNAAILTTFNEADLSAVMALRARYKEGFQKKHGVGLGFMSFFVKACVEALRAFPAVNARIDGSDIVYQHFYPLGVAVSTEKGLMAPVLRDADRMSFAHIET